jgi:hypothetical protein
VVEGVGAEVLELAGTGDQESIFVDAMKICLLTGAPGAVSSFASRRVTPVVSPSLSVVETMTAS